MKIMNRMIVALTALLLVAALATSALAVTMYVTTDQAKVRESNSKNSEVISRLPEGGSVEVLETDGNWSYIEYVNKKGKTRTGWIANKHLSNAKPHKHTWSDWRITRQPTCAKTGLKEHTCTTCGVTKTKEIERAKHQWGKWTVTKKATCAAAGEKVTTCKKCGKKGKKKIEKTGHSYGEWAVEKPATCADKGMRSRTCKVCGDKETEELEQLAHTPGPWTTLVPLTREADGERAYKCTVCGMEVRETVKAEPSLARKDKGELVKTVQNMLNALGYNVGKVDGIYGGKLDAAFSQFARDNDLVFAEGWIKPAQLDALVSAWVKSIPGEKWMGVNDSLVLTADPDGKPGDVLSFNWILTNDGYDPCTLKAVLMGKGADHDFRGDDIVALLGDEALKAGIANSLGGAFSIPATAAEDAEALSFRAVVENNKTGEIWLSNAATYKMAG